MTYAFTSGDFLLLGSLLWGPNPSLETQILAWRSKSQLGGANPSLGVQIPQSDQSMIRGQPSLIIRLTFVQIKPRQPRPSFSRSAKKGNARITALFAKPRSSTYSSLKKTQLTRSKSSCQVFKCVLDLQPCPFVCLSVGRSGLTQKDIEMSKPSPFFHQTSM